MADKEQVERLTRSVDEWNKWRQEQPHIHPDLISAILISANLSNANFSGANFSKADLTRADLSGTDLRSAYLSNADLSRANFSKANLVSANFVGANLHSANLHSVNLSMASLHHANLTNTNLGMANLTNVFFNGTIFAWIDLSNVKGLDTAKHDGPSSMDINSVVLPHDEHTRLHFLRGVGFTETQIEYLPSLLTPRPIQYHSLFISYASQDEVVAKRLYTDLRKNDVPCWFAPHDLCPGTPILRGIEEAIHLQDKFLLILSQHAVNSRWIEREVDAALHQEIKRGQDILFPIRLDNTILESDASWATRLQHRHIGDFTNWQDNTAYQEAFTALLRHLKVTKSSPA